MPDPTLSPAGHILLDAAAAHPTASWLVPGGEAGLALGLAVSHPAATVHWQPVDSRERDAISHPPSNLHIEAPGATLPQVEGVVMVAPPDRDLARRWLLVARRALANSGRLLLAGANAEGIRSVIADAGKLFGPPLREDFRSKQRIAIFAAGTPAGEAPGWIDDAGIAPGTWQTVAFELDGTRMPLVTQPGVFAATRIDAGTRLLLDALPARLEGSVLDVGCGAGVIGVAVARRGAGPVVMTDVNLLAVEAAEENIRRLGPADVRALASDVYSNLGDERYDLIVSNPPFHRGKAIDYTVSDRLIAGAPAHLADGASLLVVANAFLAYGKRMERLFRKVEAVVATPQYHVLRAAGPRE
jgi:16S rRNA (guanine1207-N2)-methyltransferase